ncbi:YciI family protein [Rugosimonospora acidiphila]|uniref:YciI family protein n=1 Tax=Rugosimonospora acidiphila TaxID=556531 RepID=A0ABP9SIF6_9ACTN
MRFVLMLCSDSTVAADLVEEGMAAGCGGWIEELARGGVLKGVEGLRPPDEATTIRVRGDEVLRCDGPFAETKDQIGGFSVIECADREEALALAARHPWAKVGQIEVRPAWEA